MKKIIVLLLISFSVMLLASCAASGHRSQTWHPRSHMYRHNL